MPTFKLFRIKELAQRKNLSIRKLGKKAGLSDSAVHEMIKRNAANILNVQKLANALEVDISELVILEDLFMPSDRDRKNVGESIKILKDFSDNYKLSGITESSQTPNGFIPLLTFDMMHSENLDELITKSTAENKYRIPNVTDADFLLNMPGTALEGDINPGDVLICKRIDKGKQIEYGRAYILETNDGFIIRRVLPHKEDGKLICSGNNPKYPPFDMEKDSILSFAKVLGFIRLE